MKWTEEETLKFVELYREQECLWNLASPTYKNKQMRQTAIEIVVKEMAKEGFGIQEAKQKIKNMRSTYNQELLKIKKSTKSGAGAADIYTPSVKWFSVLDPIMKIGRGSSQTTNNLESQIFDDDVDNDVQEHIEDEDTAEIAASREQETPVRTSTSSSQRLYGASKPSRKRRMEDLSHAVKDLRAVSQIISQPVVDYDSDEIDVFGKYVSKTLKKLSPDDAICAQQDIQGILTKYRLGNRPLSAARSYTSDSSSPQPLNNVQGLLTEQSGLLTLEIINTEQAPLE